MLQKAAIRTVTIAWAGMALASLLGGCALPRMIDSDVQSFATAHAPAAGSTYRFDRLPSQATNTTQDRVEALTEQALRKVGLNKGDATAPTTVQVQVGIAQIPNPRWPQPYAPLWLQWRERPRERNSGMLMMRMPEPPWARHSVQLVMRNASTAQAIFETKAIFDGPWYDSDNLLPAILEAALNGYPQPPAGLRRVVIELPAAPPDSETPP